MLITQEVIRDLLEMSLWLGRSLRKPPAGREAEHQGQDERPGEADGGEVERSGVHWGGLYGAAWRFPARLVVKSPPGQLIS
jgi:hypothetical protein